MTTDTERWQEFGRAITIARNARGWSQRRLAAEAGVSPTTLGALERGETDPVSSRAMPAIAQTLSWPPDIAYRHASGKDDPAEYINPRRHDLPAELTGSYAMGTSIRDEAIDELAGEIAELDDEDREVVRDLVRRLRNR